MNRGKDKKTARDIELVLERVAELSVLESFYRAYITRGIELVIELSVLDRAFIARVIQLT